MGLFSGGTDTTKNVSRPWKQQEQYLINLFRQASNLYNGPSPKYFGGNTVANFSPEQMRAFRMGSNRAIYGNQGLNAGERFNTDVINGKYSGDPYQSKVYADIQSKIAPSVNSMFSAAGRYGSGANQGELAKSLTTAFAPYASQMYQQGLDRRMGAVNNAFNFANNDYKDLAVLEQIGQKKQGQAQNELNDAKARWDYYQNLPMQRLQQYQGLITGNYGGTQSQQYQTPSMFSQLLGGGLGIAGLLGGLF